MEILQNFCVYWTLTLTKIQKKQLANPQKEEIT